LATLDARATDRRDALSIGGNRAAGLQPDGTDQPAAVVAAFIGGCFCVSGPFHRFATW